jgi:hypothetical protein
MSAPWAGLQPRRMGVPGDAVKQTASERSEPRTSIHSANGSESEEVRPRVSRTGVRLGSPRSAESLPGCRVLAILQRH